MTLGPPYEPEVAALRARLEQTEGAHREALGVVARLQDALAEARAVGYGNWRTRAEAAEAALAQARQLSDRQATNIHALYKQKREALDALVQARQALQALSNPDGIVRGPLATNPGMERIPSHEFAARALAALAATGEPAADPGLHTSPADPPWEMETAAAETWSGEEAP